MNFLYEFINFFEYVLSSFDMPPLTPAAWKLTEDIFSIVFWIYTLASALNLRELVESRKCEWSSVFSISVPDSDISAISWYVSLRDRRFSICCISPVESVSRIVDTKDVSERTLLSDFSEKSFSAVWESTSESLLFSALVRPSCCKPSLLLTTE